nr:Ig-like domain-containing protein [Halomonas sp. OfavH-34-E]
MSKAGNYGIVMKVDQDGGAGNGDYAMDRVAFQYISRDTDGDGICDDKDIDSDNDGITDNVEAQTTQDYIEPSGTDVDKDGLDDAYDKDTSNTSATASKGLTPVDTDRDSTADYIDRDSDNDGKLDIAERDDGASSITDATDTDHDGLLDIFEGTNANDGYDANDENVTENGFTLADSDDDLPADGDGAKPLVVDFDYRENAVLDRDGDGIIDTVDIDQDNDGVIDVTEGKDTSVEEKFDTTDIANDKIPDLDFNGTKVEVTSNTTEGSLTYGQESGAVNFEYSENNVATVSLATDAFVDFVIDSKNVPNSRQFDRYDQLTVSSPGAYIVVYDPDNVLNVAQGIYLNSLTFSVKGLGNLYGESWSVRVVDVKTVTLSMGWHPDYNVVANVGSCVRIGIGGLAKDTDRDNIADHLDIDSDNDGITDNVEAQTTQDYIKPTGTDVDKDGLDDAYDKDTSNITATASKGLTPVDTDGDNTVDYLDSDSDDDGKLDIAERDDGATSVSDSTDTDGDGLLDIFEGSDANDGFDANDENLVDGNFALSDSDNDIAADGSDASPPGFDLDYRDSIGPPTAVEDAGKTNEDVALVVTKDKGLLSNDTLAGATEIASAAIDTDGDGVADTALVLGQANTVKDSDGNVTGKLTLAKDGSYRFDPVANFFGALPIISYSLKGPGGYASSTLTITVTAVNDAPVVTNDKGDAKEDETLSVDKSEGLLANDSDVEGDSLVISGFSVAGVTGSFTAGEAASIPGKGTLTLNADGSYSFTPAPNYHGSVPEITYTVSDGKGGTSSGSLTITVASVEDSVSLGGLGDGSDGSDGSVNESALTGGSAAGGSGSVHTGSFTLGPASSLDSLTIGVTMITRAQLEASGTTAITITGSYGELSINGYDSDTGVVSYRYVLSSVADHGSDPVLDSFTIGTTDSDGDETYNAGTLAILVVDDVSTAKADQGSVDEDASGGSSLTGNVVSNDTLGADGAADSGALSAVGKGEAAPSGRVGSSIAGDYGSLVMDASGKYLYTLDNANATVNGLQKGQTLTETFTYQITDADGDTSTATLTITIKGANDAPTAEDITAKCAEDGETTGTIVGEDPDGDSLSFTLDAQPEGGTVTLDEDTGAFTFVPDANVNGDITFSVTVDDGHGGKTQVEVTVKISAVNDVPVASDDSASTAEDTPLIVGKDEGVLSNDSDIDGDALSVASFSVEGLTGTFTAGETATIAGVGTLTLNADGSYRFDPALNYHGSVPKVTYVLSDGHVSDTATLSITVDSVDDSVSVGGLGDGGDGVDGEVKESGLVDADGTGLTHDGTFTLGPADSLASFTLGSRSISLAELEASASSPIAIEGRYGTLTIEGYDRATGTVSYRYLLTSNADHANEPVSDDFMISVTDVEGEVTANAGTLVIDIDDDSPSATDDSGTVDEDGAAGAGSVWANDRPGADGADANGAVVGVGVEAGSLDGATGVPLEGSYGSLILNADGSYSYTLDNTNGEVDELQVGGILTEKFRYQIRDADGDLATATLTITIRGANDAPEASAEKVTASEDTPVDGKIIATDVDDDELTFSLDAQPEGGTVTLDEEGNFTFTPDANFNGDTSFTVTVTDPSGATVTVEVDVSVTPVNDAPSAKNDQATIAEDTPLTVAAEDGLLANDSDIEGDSLSVTGFSVDGIEGTFLAGQTAVIEGVGELTISANGSYRFVPALNYNGEVPLVTYTVSDDGGATSDASLSISVTAVDDKVTVGGLGDGGGEPGGGDSAGDATTDGSVDEAGLTGGSHEGLGLSHSGTFTLGPADSLSSLTLGGSTISLDQLKDCGSHPIEVTGDHGTLVLRYYDPATGEVSYTYHLASRADHSGGAVNDSFAIGVTDVEGETTDNIGTLAIAIIDDGPGTGNDRGEVSEEGSEPGSDCSGNVLLNDHYGVDGVAVDGGVTAVGSGQSSPEGGVGEPVEGRYGSLVLNADGSYSYTLDNSNPVVDALKPGQTLTETFSYTITDSDGSVSTATLTISVLGANDAPVASVDPIVTTEDTPVEGRVVATDVDNDDLTFRLDHQPDGGTVTLNEDGTFTFVPDPDVSGDISFSVTVTDASGATTTVVVTVSVEPVNDVPVASADPIVTGSGEAAAGQVVASDVEGDDLTFALDDGPRHGQFTLNPDGSFIYVPEAGFFGSDSFVVAVSDGQGGVTYVTVSVTVEPLDSLYIGDRAPEVPAQDVESDAEGPLMHADGMVDEVVNQYGGLGGLADLSTDGAVRAAVHGISALTDAEMEVVNKDQPRESSAWNSSMLQEARSLAHPGEVRATSWASSDGRATLEALVENERAWLTLPEGQRDIKVSLPGGRALPDWIQRPSIGQLLIERPAALEKVTLDIDSRGGEGEAHHYRLVLDLDKVRLEVSESEPSSPVAAPGFSEQLSRAHHRSNDLDPNLLEALALLTEHD